MLRLEKMTATHFDDYMSRSIKEYALEKVQAGSWTQEDSLGNAKLTYDRLLPDGLNTPDNFLFSIINDDNVIGYIWLGADSENKNIALFLTLKFTIPIKIMVLALKPLHYLPQKQKRWGSPQLAYMFLVLILALYMFTRKLALK